MKTPDLMKSIHRVFSIVATGCAALLVAGALGCNADSRVPVGETPAEVDPATMTTDAPPTDGSEEAASEEAAPAE